MKTTAEIETVLKEKLAQLRAKHIAETKEWLNAQVKYCIEEEQDAVLAGMPERRAYWEGQKIGLQTVLKHLEEKLE